jgi:ATP-binding cassette subfamily C protein LapB
VKAHPSGYGAQVGEQGRNLSGGQRQAVGLARALVRDPDILILDEPTSNMDVESELGVQRRLAPIIKDKTLILITHRLSMLRIVDRIIVMDGGKVFMDGPRDVVLERLRQNRAEVGAKGVAKPVSAGVARPSSEKVGQSGMAIVHTPAASQARPANTTGQEA